MITNTKQWLPLEIRKLLKQISIELLTGENLQKQEAERLKMNEEWKNCDF